MIFCDYSLTEHNVLKIYTCYSIYQYSITFYCQIIFHCMNIPHFTYQFINGWSLVIPVIKFDLVLGCESLS